MKSTHENSDSAGKGLQAGWCKRKVCEYKTIISIASISTKKARVFLVSQFKIFSWAIL